MLLVHGYPASSHMWRPALDALAARGLYAIAPDLPGFGDSEPGPARHQHLGRATSRRSRRCGEAEGLDRVALVGHDWGGLIGLRWACDHPDAVWAIVASDTGFFADGRWHGWPTRCARRGRASSSSTRMTLEGFTAMLGCDLDRHRARRRPRVLQGVRRRAAPPRPARALPQRRLREARGLRRPLAALDVPFLALWGEDDPFAPVAGAQRFAREVPGARVQVIPGTGHFVYEDAPETAAQALAAFLAESRRRADARPRPRRGAAGPAAAPRSRARRDGVPARRRAARGEPPRAARRPAGQRPLARRRPQRVDAGRLRPRRRAAGAASSSWRTGRCSATRSAASWRCSTSSTSPIARRGSSPPAPTPARRPPPGAPEDPLEGLTAEQLEQVEEGEAREQVASSPQQLKDAWLAQAPRLAVSEAALLRMLRDVLFRPEMGRPREWGELEALTALAFTEKPVLAIGAELDRAIPPECGAPDRGDRAQRRSC